MVGIQSSVTGSTTLWDGDRYTWHTRRTMVAKHKVLSNPSLLCRNSTFPRVLSSLLPVQEGKVLLWQSNRCLLFSRFPRGFLVPFIPEHSWAGVTRKGMGKSLMRMTTVALSGVINTNVVKHLTKEDLLDVCEILKKLFSFQSCPLGKL